MIEQEKRTKHRIFDVEMRVLAIATKNAYTCTHIDPTGEGLFKIEHRKKTLQDSTASRCLDFDRLSNSACIQDSLPVLSGYKKGHPLEVVQILVSLNEFSS